MTRYEKIAAHEDTRPVMLALCICCAFLLACLHGAKAIDISVMMADDWSRKNLEEASVSTATSPALLTIAIFRPSVLRDYVDFIETPHPGNSRMLADLIFEDIPLLSLNIFDISQSGSSASMLNWAALGTSIANILVCCLLLGAQWYSFPFFWVQVSLI